MAPLGLGGDPDDPKQFNLPPEERAKLIRAQALGEALEMMTPAAAGMMLYPHLRRAKESIGVLNDSLVQNRTAPPVKDIGTWLSNKFPRLSSHILSIQSHPDMPGPGMTETDPVGADGFFSHININPVMVGERQFDKIATGAHEATHTAQALRRAEEAPEWGGTNTDRYEHYYDTLDRILGYHRNPLEHSANVAGVNQANRQMMRDRAQEGPLLPHIASNQNIKNWAKATANDPVLYAKDMYEKALRAAPFGPHTAQEWGVDPAIVDELRRMQEHFARGARAPRARQRDLPLGSEKPNLPPEFTAVGDEPPVIRPERKAPEFPTAEQMNRNAKAPKYSRPFGDDAPSFDISNLATAFGYENRKRPVKITLSSSGDKSIVTIERFGVGAHSQKLAEPIVYEVPSEMADVLRQKSFDLERGKVTNARGVSLSAPGPRK